MAPADAIYCYDTASVRFAIYDRELRIVAEITENALRDVFGARGGADTLVETYQQHASTICAIALERHQAALRRPIVLDTVDFSTRATPGAT